MTVNPAFKRLNASLLSIAALILLIAQSQAAIIVWDESLQGDLSNNQSAPTGLTLSSGDNSVIGTVAAGNQDWLTFAVPAGFQLTAVTPVVYTPGDTTSFTGVQSGSSFVGNSQTAAPYLGYAHFGTGPGNVGNNILPTMGTGAGAQGFTPPLNAGNYVFLIQQAGASTGYRMDYTLTAVPEPPAQAAVAALLCGAYFLRRRFVRGTKTASQRSTAS